MALAEGTPPLTLELINERLKKVEVAVGQNKDSCRNLTTNYVKLNATADATAADSKAARRIMERVGAEWGTIAGKMGLEVVHEPQQPGDQEEAQEQAPGGGLRPFAHTPIRTVGAGGGAVAKDKEPMRPKATEAGGKAIKRKAAVSTTAKASDAKASKTSGEGDTALEVGDIRWDCKPMRQRGGQRLKYAVFGGGCAVVYKKPPKFTAAQVKDHVKKALDKYGNVSFKSAPRSVAAWGRYWNVCREAAFGLFVGCLVDLADDTPVFLVGPILTEVDGDDVAGFIKGQPQPLRGAMEAVLAETNFDALQDKGPVDTKELVTGMAGAARNWHVGLLAGFEQQHLEGDVP